jgi:hypothetical protein
MIALLFGIVALALSVTSMWFLERALRELNDIEGRLQLLEKGVDEMSDRRTRNHKEQTHHG